MDEQDLLDTSLDFLREFINLHLEYDANSHEDKEENLLHRVRDFFRDNKLNAEISNRTT